MTPRIQAVLISVLLVAPACSNGDGESSTGPRVAASHGEIEALCDAQCTRSEECSDEQPELVGAACVADCIADLGALAENLRGDIVQGLADCTRRVPCGESDDQCAEQALEAVGESIEEVTGSKDVQACVSKEDECDDTEGDFSDDLCGVLPLLVTPQRERMARCFDGPCNGIPACVDPIAGS